MTPKTLAAAILAPTLLLAGCTENEESIQVRPDGTILVEVTAGADGPQDLADGYPVPLHGPFAAANDGAHAWLAAVGPHTGDPGDGSGAIRERAMAARARLASREDRIELSSRARFASVEDWPEWYAPEADPYRTAYLRRSAALRVDRHDARRVYVFERTYHGRSHWTSVWDTITEEMPDELEEKLSDVDDLGELTDEEWRQLLQSIAEGFGDMTDRFLRDALAGIYTRGSAELPLASHQSILARVREDVDAKLSKPRLQALLDEVRAWDEAEEQGTRRSGDEHPLPAFEQTMRDTMRRGLERALEEEDVRQPVRFAVLERIEWSFTALDHTSDLGDESFRVVVAMPGTIVAGDFDELDSEGRAVFRFDGGRLRQGDVRMRVVSVLE